MSWLPVVTLSAWQLLSGNTARVPCGQLRPAVVVRTTAALATTSRREVCEAAARSVKAVAAIGRADSAHVVYHEFPELHTTRVMRLYQVGVFVGATGYREVVVNRATWRAEVQPREGRK